MEPLDITVIIQEELENAQIIQESINSFKDFYENL